MNIQRELNMEDFFNKTKMSKTGASYKESAFTHYLHNNNKVSSVFLSNAVAYVQDILTPKFPDQEITSAVAEEALQYLLFNFDEEIPFPKPQKPKFTFIDLFAGIGGFRLAFQRLEGNCVFTSEWDKYSQKTYQANFGEIPFGDITKESNKSFIPNDFDVLCAGFPCQAFSIAGKRGGFEDTRGTLFFDVAEIIKRKQPKAFFLENVKGLKNHDRGKTLATILNTLREDLNYFVLEPQILNAKNFGVPQNRERIFIVGFRKDLGISEFSYPSPTKEKVSIKQILESQEVSVKYYLSTTYLDTLRKHKERHKKKGNGFGYEIIPNKGIANAVVCGGMGKERNLVYNNRLGGIDLSITQSNRALCSNLFVRNKQKVFPLQSLKQKAA